ncbi:MAG: Ppx/GppA phosphatase family protein [Rhizomicrobium sp.]
MLAAIDLGTNNCRLLIGRMTGDNLNVVDSFSRIVRLGEHMAQTGRLSEPAMRRTLDALKICADRINRHKDIRVRAVATAACRRAANAGELIERATAETGLQLDVVSAQEEARLAALGCAPLVGDSYQGALVFDIGGGSTEVIWLKRKAPQSPAPATYSAENPAPAALPAGKVEMVHFCSVPVGVMTLAESEHLGYAEMYAMMLEHFAAMRREMDGIGPFDVAGHHLLGTSGTVTTLAGIALKLPRYVRSKVDGTWHDCTAMYDITQSLIGLDRPARTTIGCVGEERADLIIPGCAIYNAIQATWPCDQLRVADRGLREGILRDLLKE